MDQLLLGLLQGLFEVFKARLVLLRFRLDLADVGYVGAAVILLFVCLSSTVRGFLSGVVHTLCFHDLVTMVLDDVDGLFVFVLMVLHLLQMGDHIAVVVMLLGLHLRVEVFDIRLEFLDLLPRVLIEIVDHVFLDLECVSLHFRVLQLLAQVLDRDLQLLTTHDEELVLRLGLLSLFPSLLTLLFLSAHG